MLAVSPPNSFQSWREPTAVPGAAAIGGATFQVGTGVELGFLGKVLRLLKATR